MFCVWLLEFCRHEFKANYLALYHGHWPYVAFQAACQASNTYEGCSWRLGWRWLPFFYAQSHIGSVKPGMKGLGLLYFCQVNKSRCLGRSLWLQFVIKVQGQLLSPADTIAAPTSVSLELNGLKQACFWRDWRRKRKMRCGYIGHILCQAAGYEPCKISAFE